MFYHKKKTDYHKKKSFSHRKTQKNPKKNFGPIFPLFPLFSVVKPKKGDFFCHPTKKNLFYTKKIKILQKKYVLPQKKIIFENFLIKTISKTFLFIL